MPLKKGRSKAVISANIEEMLHKYKETGAIGNARPASMAKARQVAAAAAHQSAQPKHKGARRKGVKGP